MRVFHEECFIAEAERGALRYLEGREVVGKPRIRVTADLTGGGV